MNLAFRKTDFAVIFGGLCVAVLYWQAADKHVSSSIPATSSFPRDATNGLHPQVGDEHGAQYSYDDELLVPSADVGVPPTFHTEGEPDEECDDDEEAALADGMEDGRRLENTVPLDRMMAPNDPNLRSMTGKYSDFKAYVRPDINTFYQQPPGTYVEQEPSFHGQAGKFVNMAPVPRDLHWEDSRGVPRLIQQMKPWSAGGTATFPRHSFIMTEQGNPDNVLCRWSVVPDVSMYYCNHFEAPDTFIGSAEAKGQTYYATPSTPTSLGTLAAQDRQSYDAHVGNLEFAAEYKAFTGGVEWLSMYPRPPPQHLIWPSEYLGQTHTVVTTETHFTSHPPSDKLRHRLSINDMRRRWDGEYSPNIQDALWSMATLSDAPSQDLPLAEYREPGSLTLKIKAASCAPKAFEIEDFLSGVEVDHLVNIINRMNMERSTTNGHLSSTRTSRTTWLPRNTDAIVNSIFIRAADALRLDESMLRRRRPDEALSENDDLAQRNEELQIVHYNQTQEYTAHHDFGYPGRSVYPDGRAPASRSINFCLYLNDVDEGGQTKFPRWRSALTQDGIAVQPKRGKALIFYMVLPDGNLDDLSHHAALPVLKGYKMFSNLWIWDPERTSL